MSDVAETVRALVLPIAQRHGVDLVEVAVRGSGSRMRVRLMVDRKGGVDVGTCQALSGDASRALDDHDPIAGRYVLEVTSPGTDHPLADQRAFDRVEGREVVVRIQGGELRGRVVAAEDDAVVLAVGDDEERVAYTAIDRATQALPW